MSPAGLILFHGAGGDREHPLFVALEDRLAIPVDRIDFPYRRKGPGRRPPDRMPKLLDAVREAVRSASERWATAPESIVLGGRSMGGRAASLAVADGLPAAGLVLLSYPLHPPGKPDKLRVEHFASITCPVLFVSGDRDPFAKPDELAEHVASIPASVTEHWLTGPRSGHDPKGRVDDIVPIVQDWIGQLG